MLLDYQFRTLGEGWAYGNCRKQILVRSPVHVRACATISNTHRDPCWEASP